MTGTGAERKEGKGKEIGGGGNTLLCEGKEEKERKEDLLQPGSSPGERSST